MKQALQVATVLRFATSDTVRLVSALERCLDTVESSDLVLHWSFPLHALLQDSSRRADHVIDRLRERRNDRILPIGFTGAYHVLLSIEELQKELEWTTENPWAEDMKTVFGSDADVLFPLSLDLLRSPARRRYGEGCTFLAAATSGDAVFAVKDEIVHTLPAVVPTHLDKKRLSKELRRLCRDRDDYVLLVLNGLAPSRDALSQILSDLRQGRLRRRKIRPIGLDEILDRLPEGSRDLLPLFPRLEPVPVDPVSRSFRSRSMGRAGGRRRADDLTKRRLEGLTVVDVDEGSNATEQHVQNKERTLVADMSGEVTLSESDVSVRFLAGRMTGIRRGQREMLAGRPTVGRIILDERTFEFPTVSAFSFEGRKSRGLRVIQRLDGDAVTSPGEIVGDYSFEEGTDDLLVSVTVTYPELKSIGWIDQYSVIELPLFRVAADEGVEVEGEYPDGERYSLRLNPVPSPLQLCGARFRFSAGDRAVRLSFPDLPTHLPEVLPVVFRKGDTGHLFCINPRGSYSQTTAAAFIGITEQFHFSINTETNRPEDRE